MEEWIDRVVKHDIIKSGLVLVAAGTRLDLTHMKLLEQHRVDFSELILLPYGAELAQRPPIKSMQQASSYSKGLFDDIKRTRKVPLMDIKNELIPLVSEIASYQSVFNLIELIKAKGEYTHQHNIAVGVISTMIGRWMELSESELTLLTLAGTLHDIGKVRVSDELLNKPGKLSAEEYGEIKLHTRHGYEILSETVGLNPRAALVALQHHERADGQGYPLKLRNSQVDPLSRIVAVADVFHAMSSKRPYHEALPFHEVVTQMRAGAFGELDSKVVNVFLEKLFVHLIGHQIKLTDGRWGEVVYLNPHDDLHPLVKVEETFVDLSQIRDLHILEIVL
ncbi:HD-GYP domain-containing protein [Cohnella fermenti]|uniref:HD-GYP domain-containing protein n=1 Tax=Cohnella fermenti TaxID=2565925 RepID=A0A4S4C864_9BACL|nr:HD-GYP domain-containing protein [Cohnella fermenti]THF84202.1 HD-GYP domain-containing protein [Cohnella fermenti]